MNATLCDMVIYSTLCCILYALLSLYVAGTISGEFWKRRSILDCLIRKRSEFYCKLVQISFSVVHKSFKINRKKL